MLHKWFGLGSNTHEVKVRERVLSIFIHDLFLLKMQNKNYLNYVTNVAPIFIELHIMSS